MKTSIVLFLFISLTALVSCSSTQLISETASNSNQIYYIGHGPDGKEYQIVGYLETSGWIFTPNSKLLEGMKNRADKIGADALIDVQFGYIPHVVTGIPYATAYAVKWK